MIMEWVKRAVVQVVVVSLIFTQVIPCGWSADQVAVNPATGAVAPVVPVVINNEDAAKKENNTEMKSEDEKSATQGNTLDNFLKGSPLSSADPESEVSLEEKDGEEPAESGDPEQTTVPTVPLSEVNGREIDLETDPNGIVPEEGMGSKNEDGARIELVIESWRGNDFVSQLTEEQKRKLAELQVKYGLRIYEGESKSNDLNVALPDGTGIATIYAFMNEKWGDELIEAIEKYFTAKRIELELGKSVFGEQVYYCETVFLPQGVDGAPRITRFFDKERNLIGEHRVNASRKPTVDAWYAWMPKFEQNIGEAMQYEYVLVAYRAETVEEMLAENIFSRDEIGYAIVHLPPAGMQGAPTNTLFFRADGTLIGRHQVAPLAPDSIASDAWYAWTPAFWQMIGEPAQMEWVLVAHRAMPAAMALASDVFRGEEIRYGIVRVLPRGLMDAPQSTLFYREDGSLVGRRSVGGFRPEGMPSETWEQWLPAFAQDVKTPQQYEFVLVAVSAGMEEMNKARDLFGEKISFGIEFLNSKSSGGLTMVNVGAPSVRRFYDANGQWIGEHDVSGSLPPSSLVRDVWYGMDVTGRKVIIKLPALELFMDKLEKGIFDFNDDGIVDARDVEIAENTYFQVFGMLDEMPKSYLPGLDLNGDARLDELDVELLRALIDKDGIPGLLERLSKQETITLEDALLLRRVQAEFKELIEAMPEGDARDVEIEKFKKFLEASDKIMTKSLKIVLSDGAEIIVRSTQDLLTLITKEYKKMDQTGEIDWTRLAGISEEDIAGLPTLKDYLDSRRIGKSIGIPVFDVQSPLSTLMLIDRLVRKYHPDIKEGELKVLNVPDFLRYVNGTKQTFDKAMEVAKEMFAKYQVHLPSGPLTVETIRAVLTEFSALNEHLTQAVLAVISGFTGERVFQDALISDITNELMSNAENHPAYGTMWNELLNVFWRSDVVYQVNGREVRVSMRELNDFTNGLPWDSKNLYRYPGIKAEVDPSFLSGLISAEYYNSLSGIRLYPQLQSNPIPPLKDLLPVNFSYPAHRFELLEAFLKTWGDEVITAEGKVDFDTLRSRLLFSYEIELALARAEKYIAGKVEEMRAFAAKAVFTPADYQAMKALLQSVEVELQGRFESLLDDVIYDTYNEVTARVNERFQDLVEAFSDVLGEVRVTVVTASGETIVFDPRTLNAEALQPVLNATSIPQPYWGFLREMYERLGGIDSEDLKNLLSPDALRDLKTFSFNTYPASWSSMNLAYEEVVFGLIPQLVGKLGTVETDAVIAALSEGLSFPVSIGESLETVVKGIVKGLCDQGLDAMKGIQINSLEDLLAFKEIYEQLTAALKENLADYVAHLSAQEKSTLESWINGWSWESINAGGNLYPVRDYFYQQMNQIDFLTVDGVEVPVRQILAIENFPWSKEYDEELFAGLKPRDFKDVETWMEADDYLNFRFEDVNYYDANGLSSIGRIEVIANVIRRLLSANPLPESAKDVFFTNQNGVREVDPEALRKYLKGVEAMQKAVMAEAKELCEKIASKLEGMRKGKYTIEEIQALYDEVLKLRASLVELLTQKAGKHERRDVIAVEDKIQLVFQKKVFDLFVSMVGEAKLIIKVGGRNVTIPAKEITDAMLAYLTDTVGDSVAAHHFAAFYGIGMGDIRNLDKLEQFLSNQVVALPRNSEYVQIVSQVSELGYMQLAALLVERFQDEVVRGGRVDINRLIELLTNRELALKRAAGMAEKSYEEAVAALDEILAEDGTIPVEEVAGIFEAVQDLRNKVISELNDALSGKDEAMKAELETIANRLNEKMKAYVEKFFSEHAVRFGKNTFLLDGEVIAQFEALVEALLAQYPDRLIEDLIVLDPDIRLKSVMDISVAKMDVISLEVPSFDLGLVKNPAQIETDIWLPIRPVKDYNPKDHPTRELGLRMLLAGTIERMLDLGISLFNKKGTFNWKRFAAALQKSDYELAADGIRSFYEEDLPAFAERVDSLRDSRGAVSIGDIPELSGLYEELSAKLKYLTEIAGNEGAQALNKLNEVYGEAVSVLSIGGVLVDVKALTAVLVELEKSGELSEEFAVLLKELVKGDRSVSEVEALEVSLKTSAVRELISGRVSKESAGLQVSEDKDIELGMDDVSFTLGQLANIPFWASRRNRDLLSGLDVAGKAKHLYLTLIPPEKLLGLLDMRALAAGSGVSAGGMMKLSAMAMDNAMVAAPVLNAEVIGSEIRESVLVPEAKDALNLGSKSVGFLATELLPALIGKMTAMGLPISGPAGEIDGKRFELALQGKLPPVRITRAPIEKRAYLVTNIFERRNLLEDLAGESVRELGSGKLWKREFGVSGKQAKKSHSFQSDSEQENTSDTRLAKLLRKNSIRDYLAAEGMKAGETKVGDTLDPWEAQVFMLALSFGCSESRQFGKRTDGEEETLLAWYEDQLALEEALG